ncbi:ATP-binding cassette domain-containing protein [Brevibacterium sp. ZH18]|uniref:ATP-binding cassette domain-containing protein n=1 Tax=Brevibacterium sp. ZH18 TaxID=2927784 RepID=UPI001F609AF8|nr:ATP-binding cassette domain-containing protein [Brevibacterium sp. ZH18]MCI4012565.1 ATP-binding cassette domain-containing protein [Brevibacterium sp. ZH18]
MMSLTLDDIGFVYRGADSPALDAVTLSVEPAQMHAVLGPLGSGTSTLCRLVAGLLTDRGTVSGVLHLNGSAVMLGDDPEAQLSGMTSVVGDEVQLPGRLNGNDSAPAISRAHTALDSLGIDHLWKRRLETLSGGQRQLVALAGLLTLRPMVLVLDQPSLSLDPHTRKRLVTALRTFCDQGGSVLITAHQLDDLTDACDRVSILDAGRLTTTDSSVTPAEARRHGIWDSRRHDAEPMAQPHGRPDPERRPTSAGASQLAPSPVLSARGLSVVRGQSTVLDSVDLDLGAGELVTIMGPNGAGKSTLLRHLLGLIEPDARTAGTITTESAGDVLRLEELVTHQRSRHLGWVGQDPGSQLSAATVRAEVETSAPLPPHRRRDRPTVRAHRHEAAASAIMDMDLTEAGDTHPYDLDIARRKDVVMASALVTSPRILLLDEPTLGRDHAAITRLNAFISRFLRRGGSILATTHDRAWAAAMSNRILRLDAGTLYPAPES